MVRHDVLKRGVMSWDALLGGGLAGWGVVGVLLVIAGGCREPSEVNPAIEMRAVSADSSHIQIEFPEALDPVAMSDPSNYRVEMPVQGRPSQVFDVYGAAVVDSVYGRCVQIETARIPDGVSLHLSVQEIRLLTGPRLGRSELSVRMVTGLSYGKDIAPLFASSCNRCHSGSQPSGEYPTDGYYALFATGTNPPEDLIPGDASCLLVAKCQPGASMFYQGGLEFIDASMIRNWVVFYLARQ